MVHAKVKLEPHFHLTALLQAASLMPLASLGSFLSLTRVVAGLLRQEQNAGNNERQQNAGGSVAAEGKAAMINWLIEQIA